MRKKTQCEVELIYSKEGYELLSEYKNNRTPNIVKCPIGHTFDTMTLWSFEKGNRCPICSHKAKLSYEYVKQYFESYGYMLISKKYINANSKMDILCSSGHKFSMTYGKFYSGSRCPHCNMTSGEQEIARILNKYEIEYNIQYRFSNCRNTNPLPFDFYIKNTIRPICIEFDGDMHFKPRGTDTLEYFMYRKYCDGLKNEYCLKNGIKLIRIPYWDFQNIEQILKQKLYLI